MIQATTEELNLTEIKGLLKRVEKETGSAVNRVKCSMNSFVIAAGEYVSPVMKQAKATAKKLGIVHVDMRATACKVPLALEYIERMEK